MAKKAIKDKTIIRGMDIDMFDDFLDFSGSIKDNPEYKDKPHRANSAVTKWILEHVYPDMDFSGKTRGTVEAIAFRTIEASNAVEEEDIKNFEVSGSGESQVDLNSVKLADKPQD